MSKSNSRLATSVLAFRMTPDESAQLRAVAASQGMGPTTFARRAAFAAAALPTPVYEAKIANPGKAELAKILGQLGRMASSLNQLAKVANSSKSPASAKELKVLFAEVRALRTDLLKEH